MECMIQANELRIGNWVNEATHDLSSGLIVLQHTVVCGNMIKTIELSKNAHHYRPIPLTPEILEKAGFVKKVGDITTWGLDGVSLMKSKEVPGSYVLCGMIKRYLTRLHYLHQLQNLYFALTGQELNIEL